MEPMKPVQPLDSIIAGPIIAGLSPILPYPPNNNIDPLNSNPMEILKDQSGRISLGNILDISILAVGTYFLGTAISGDIENPVGRSILAGSLYLTVAAHYAVSYINNLITPSATPYDPESQ